MVNKDFEQIDFIDDFTGYKEYYISGNTIEEKNIEDISSYKTDNKSILLNSLNSLDDFYYVLDNNEDKILIKEEKENSIIELKKGLFLFSFYNIEKNYLLNYNGFSIEPLSSGRLLLDIGEKNKVNIFSFDGIFDIKINKLEDNEEMTNLFLYPHMYLNIDLSRNKFLKNADFYRLSSIFDIGYISESLLADKGTINNNFFDSILFGSKSGKKDFLTLVFSVILSESNNIKDNFSSILEFNISNVSGLDYIYRYFSFFLNDEKKKIFYKNLILSQLGDLFISKEKNNISLINEIKGNLDLLKILDIDDYNELKNIIKGYYSILVFYNNIDYINAKVNYLILLSNINNTKINIYDSYIYLNSLYLTYDFKVGEKDYKEYLVNFLPIYYKDLNIKLEKGEFLFEKDNFKQKENNIKNLNYFSFLFKNLLLEDLNLGDNTLDSSLDLLSNFILINDFLLNYNDEKFKITLLYDYNKLINNILDSFKNTFFEKDRNDKGLLLIKDDLGVDSKNYNNLINNINLLVDFITQNKKFLDRKVKKNKLLFMSFFDINKIFEEYSLASSDYKKYLVVFDKEKEELLNTSTLLSDKNQKIILSVPDIERYLKQFRGVGSNIDISIDGNIYKINNLVINGKSFSFDINPFFEKEMSNIKISGDKKSFSYKLDLIKEQWDEKFKEAEDEDREKYDFKNFFLNTFFKKEKVKTEIYATDINLNTDDKGIVVLKKDKLLGTNGDFTAVKNILDIKYDDIKVTDNNGEYDIYIDNSTALILDTTRDDKEKIYFDFSSEYIFNETKHGFSNIVLNPYKLDNKIKKYIIGDDFSITLSGYIDTLSLEKWFNDNLSNLKSIFEIGKSIKISNINIVYLLKINKLKLSFDYYGTNIILFSDIDGNIFKVSVEGKKMDIENFNYKELSEKLLNNL